MTRTFKFTAALMLTLSGVTSAQAKIQISATLPDLAAIAAEVAGPRAEIRALSLPTQDPHFVDARPHLVLQLNRADLLLLAGLELESGWLPVLLKGARNPKIQPGSAGHLDCSSLVRLSEVPTGRIDRSMGDIHPGGNPHYLLAPENGIRIARGIARRLSRIDPQGTKSYWTGAKGLIAKIKAGQQRWREQLRPFTGTEVVAYHRSWIYFTDAMGLKIAAHIEPKPGIPPNATHVLRTIKQVQSRRIPIILQEEYYPDHTSALIAKKSGARLVLLPGGTNFKGGQSYVQRLDLMVRKIAEALAARGKE